MILNTSAESVGPSPAQAASHTLLPAENRFTCLPECGLCCSYRVLVTETDRRRLEVSESDPIPWVAEPGGELALPRTSEAGAGFCLYLDCHRRCTVHRVRPEHCRVYPYLWTTYHGMELDVDVSCPGLGHGEATPKEWLQAPVERPEQQAQRERAVHAVESMLRAQQRYASPKMLADLGEHCLDELAAVWATGVRHNARTLGVKVAQPNFLNMENERELETLRHGLRLIPRSASELTEDAAWLRRHFVRPQWGTRLSSGGAVTLYRFWIDGDLLYTEARGGSQRKASVEAAAPLPWQSDALATRRAYLRRWLGRQLLVRLASNLAMAALMPGSHVATEYLKLLFEIDQRLALLAPALARISGKEAVDRPSALEAIRGSDALLRAWCESARVSVIA